MIPVAKPDLGEQELAQIEESLESGWIGLGPKVDEFESQFANQFGHDHVIATNSCTNALDLALKVTDPEGIEVLVSPITWISSAFAGIYNGYEIGWVDVRGDTLNMNPEALQDRITDKTAAVIAVHYGGQPAEIEPIVDIAHDHGAIVIEDCAHAVGSTVNGTAIGSIGDIGCFSFQATKPLTTGEGGALVTDDGDIAKKAKLKSKLGVDKSTHERSKEDGYNWYYEVQDVGHKYFMHDISAGIGLAQLERLPETRSRRNEVAKTYTLAFENLDWLIPLSTRRQSTHARYNYTVRVPSDHRETIIKYLDSHDIGASVHYMPLYKHPVFKDHDPDLDITETVWEQLLTLPMSSTLTDDEIASVINSLKEYGEGRAMEAPSAGV